MTEVALREEGSHRPPGGIPTARTARPRVLPVGWPVVALFGFYPLWWVLGLATFVSILVAIPMTVELIRRREPLRLPPGFGLWALLLIWVVLSAVMLRETAPGTLPPTGTGKYISFAVRCLQYVSLTVVMLYIGNLSERELPRRRVVRLLGVLFVVTAIGGFLGMLFPYTSVKTPMAYLLPSSIAEHDFVSRLVTVEFAQVHNVLDSGPTARPSAPYDYTNIWGECWSQLLVWFVLALVLTRSTRWRIAGALLAVASLVPMIYSLNRGVWIGLGVSVAYLVVRFAMQGRLVPLAGVCVGLAVLAGLLVGTPLKGVVLDRIAHPHSNDTRASLSALAVQAAMSSPVLGYGGTRQTIGSEKSIAVGATRDCPMCGNRDVGSDGQLWNLLIQQGFVGAFLYVAFFLSVAWRYRRDTTPLGLAGGLSVLLPLVYMLVYPAIGMPLAVALVSVALLWRNDVDRRRAAATGVTP